MFLVILNNIFKVAFFLFITFCTFIGGNNIKVKNIEIEIESKKNDVNINEIIPYETTYIYNSKRPSTASKIIKNGEIGLINKNTKKIVKNPVSEVVEKGTGPKGEFVGKLTGYTPYCKGCSSSGTVACKTKDNQKHSLINNGINYTDHEYGKVRILSATKEFPCGTIIKIEVSNEKYIYGVVLDRGNSMNRAYENGLVWLDLSYLSTDEMKNENFSGNKKKFSVQRWGF